jgi:hypothetical protein
MTAFSNAVMAGELGTSTVNAQHRSGTVYVQGAWLHVGQQTLALGRIASTFARSATQSGPASAPLLEPPLDPPLPELEVLPLELPLPPELPELPDPPPELPPLLPS